jgi:glycosyltransferase involved in cell wall biosynthesis
MEKALGIVRPTLDLMPLRRHPRMLPIMFSPAWVPFTGFARRINESDADVAHLHWVAGGMMRIEDLAYVRKPIVWSLHDMWGYTGGCHIDAGCGRFRTHCGACPALGSTHEHDLSHRVFERKARTLARVRNLTIVGLSGWMAACARESTLFRDLRVVHLPNPIDTGLFKPVEQRIVREMLGLPVDRKLLLFGGYKATDNPYKGFAELSKALDGLRGEGAELMILGANRPKDPPDLGSPTHYMGSYQDELSLALLYNAADVTIVPSHQENLSNTIMESLACGTPVVAFDIGGNADMVEHRVNGWLAKPLEADHLAEGIRWTLANSGPAGLREAARRTVEERFERSKVAQRYHELYKEVLNAAR